MRRCISECAGGSLGVLVDQCVCWWINGYASVSLSAPVDLLNVPVDLSHVSEIWRTLPRIGGSLHESVNLLVFLWISPCASECLGELVDALVCRWMP